MSGLVRIHTAQTGRTGGGGRMSGLVRVHAVAPRAGAER